MHRSLFDHVKDDDICLDQTEHLLQTATCRAHEANTKTKEGKPHVPPPASGTPYNSKTFVRRDGKQHSYLIAPNDFKKMTEEERKAELTCL
jgi:hypothetical protein